MTTLLIVAVVIVVALIAFFAVRASRSPVTVMSAAELEARQLDEGIVGDVVPIGPFDDVGAVPIVSTESDVFDDVEAPPSARADSDVGPIVSNESDAIGVNGAPVERARERRATRTPRRFDIRWAKRFETADDPFDDETRLGLLHDLGIVRAPWGVPLLAQAYEEEPDVEHRRAALRSLAAYRHPDTQGTFDVALHSDDDEERAIAEHALTALQIRAALPS